MGKSVFNSGEMCGLVLKETFAILSKIAKDLIRISQENNVIFPDNGELSQCVKGGSGLRRFIQAETLEMAYCLKAT